jgi:LPXTG-site transpeptidase (sortase) family protein
MRRVSLIIAALLVGLTLVLPATAARSSAREAVSIPKIGVSTKIGADLSRGAIYWRRVGRPGQGTTIAIAAHNITPVPGFRGHGPFHDINRLAKGDKVTVTHAGRQYGYRVTGRRVLPSTDLHIADLTRYERLLLTTCWPRGSSKYRLVVYAQPAKL